MALALKKSPTLGEKQELRIRLGMADSVFVTEVCGLYEHRWEAETVDIDDVSGKVVTQVERFLRNEEMTYESRDWYQLGVAALCMRLLKVAEWYDIDEEYLRARARKHFALCNLEKTRMDLMDECLSEWGHICSDLITDEKDRELLQSLESVDESLF